MTSLSDDRGRRGGGGPGVGQPLVIVPKSSSTQYSRLIQYYTVRVQDLKLTDRLLESGVRFEGEDTSASSSIINFIVGWVLPSVLMIGLLYMMFSRMGGGGGIMGVGKSNAKVYVQKETGVTFADVAGEDEPRSLWWRSWIFSIIPRNTQRSAPSSPREPFWWASGNG